LKNKGSLGTSLDSLEGSINKAYNSDKQAYLLYSAISFGSG